MIRPERQEMEALVQLMKSKFVATPLHDRTIFHDCWGSMRSNAMALLFICGHTFKIYLIAGDIFDFDEHKIDETISGEISYQKEEIYIKEDLSFSAMKQTIAHEIVHAICFITGLNAINERESLIQALALGITGTDVLGDVIGELTNDLIEASEIAKEGGRNGKVQEKR